MTVYSFPQFTLTLHPERKSMPLNPKPEQGPAVLPPEGDHASPSIAPAVLPAEHSDDNSLRADEAKARDEAKAQAEMVKAQDKADGHKE